MTKIKTNFVEGKSTVKVSQIPPGTMFTGSIGIYGPSMFLKGDFKNTLVKFETGTQWDSENGTLTVENYRPLRTVTITGEY
jgi:hypothetical protein